jgi:tape measure domain-containing protein
MPQDGINIYMSLIDKVSSPLDGIGKKTKAFSKELQELEQKTEAYSKTQDKLTKETMDYRKKLEQANLTVQTAKKEFKKYKDEAHKGALDKAIEEQEEYKRKLRESEAAMKSNYKALGSMMDQQRKAGNQSGGDNLLGSLKNAGLFKMAGDALSQAAGAGLESALGQPTATAVSSILSGIASGAAMGAVTGTPHGVAAGALVGAGVGIVNAATAVGKASDDAFRSYVQEAAESQLAQRDSDITSGSSIAAGRETDLISFSTLFKDRGVAQDYLKGLVDMANTTPFLYDDLTAMSKTLATYGYGAEGILPVLRTIGDTGAALSMSTSDMSMVAQALGRMKSSNKTTLEYLNILNDRGIGAVGMLAEAKGKSQGEIYDMISKGQIAGTEAVEIILQALTDSFAGSMREQSRTFSGLSSTLEGMEQEMQNAYGEGYNEARNKGLLDQIDWLSGTSGDAQKEANRAIGAWQASLENAKEESIRKAVNDAMETGDYQKAKAAGDAAEMGRILMQAKVKGMNEYNASDGAQEALAAEKAMVDGIRADTAMNEDYWDAGYERGQWFSKGVAAGIADGMKLAANATAIQSSWEAFGGGGNNSYFDIDPGSFAVGLNRVPYDNFPALLHEGERVLTASQARAEERGGPTVQVTVTGNSFYGSDAAMEDRVAQKVAREVARAVQLGV